MDTFIKVVGDDNSYKAIAAHEFGFDDLMYKACDILVRICKRDEVKREEMNFIWKNFKFIEPSKYQEFEFIIDEGKQIVHNEVGLEIYDLKVVNTNVDIALCKRIDYDDVDLLMKEDLTFDEFEKMYAFLDKIFKYRFVLLNERYLFHVNTK